MVHGARVIAVASAKNTDFVLSLGADRVVDYQTAGLEHCAAQVDVVFDTVGGPNAARLVTTMKCGGRFVTIARGLPADEQAAAAGITARNLLVRPDAGMLVEIARRVDEGFLTPQIEKVYPFSETRSAHIHGEAGHVCGKLVLNCPD